ncbi:hypothetical protein [Ferrimonas lipolytica]|uniref:Lipoprotein n=1 Tax=Ferrimonas lipolytica TaxID=2724191 RepID=A0A6H1UBC5_9GAMM|nr:hypothetical protein [Ferrimonas lipolytica]QIZ75663.1 hypothetical protein HER31_01340 [Ferrimonas lipolytica]
MRLKSFSAVIIAALSSVLSGCSSLPTAVPELDYTFWANTQKSEQAEFRITFFTPSETWFKQARTEDDPLLNDHFLFVHLEKELDQRQLCLQGYEITERRRLTKGITLSGECHHN